MSRNARLVLAGLLVPAVLTAGANATLFYVNTFQSGTTYPEWSSNQTYTEEGVFTRFLGRYTNSGVMLTLDAPPRPRDEVPGGGDGGDGGGGGGPPPPPPPPVARGYVLDFSFFCIDSWDGSDPAYGLDHFAVRVNGQIVFDETFANQHLWQSYQGDPAVGRSQLGFDQRWNDSIYGLSVPFATDDPVLRIEFFAYGLHGVMNDESWGIDNVRVSTVPVPAPAGAAVLGLGGLVAMRRRRG